MKTSRITGKDELLAFISRLHASVPLEADIRRGETMTTYQGAQRTKLNGTLSLELQVAGGAKDDGDATG